MVEQRTTLEQRATARERARLRDDKGFEYTAVEVGVLTALLDDADALAGALAERDDAMEAQENAWRNVNLLTRRLSEERVALHEEVARLHAALRGGDVRGIVAGLNPAKEGAE